MRSDIHPEYHKIMATCACGNEFELGSVIDEMKVEICSACHPFFTGKQIYRNSITNNLFLCNHLFCDIFKYFWKNISLLF